MYTCIYVCVCVYVCVDRQVDIRLPCARLLVQSGADVNFKVRLI